VPSSVHSRRVRDRETLHRLHLHEKARSAWAGGEERRIVGLYVGWRGDSRKGKLLRNLTFFGRKNTAHKVGSDAVTEWIVRLKELQREKVNAERDRGLNYRTRLVIVGHSFGGALVFSATSQLLMERLAVADAREGPVEGLGDLVVLVNPAFEAARYQPLHANITEPEREPPYGEDQKPVLAVFTSTGDTATGNLFPLGRFLSAKKDDYRTDSLGELEKRSNRSAVGHFSEFRTHHLAPNAGTPPPEKVNDEAEGCGCPYLPKAPEELRMTDQDMAEMEVELQRLRDERKSGGAMKFSTATLEPKQGSPFSPLLMVSVDDSIIQGHNDIYRPAFIKFLTDFIYLLDEPWSTGG